MSPMLIWNGAGVIQSQRYSCAACGSAVASNFGWAATEAHNPVKGPVAFICICHLCTTPTTLYLGGKQVPGAPFGNPVSDISDGSVASIYEEARSCISVGAFTAAVLACRKLLMHVAVSKGAAPGKAFTEYVAFLSEKHYVPPDATDWVDHIRKGGNEATHEIVLSDRANAEELLRFSEMLLRLVFEFPAAARRRSLAPSA